MGLVSQVFKEDTLASMKGNLGIGRSAGVTIQLCNRISERLQTHATQLNLEFLVCGPQYLFEMKTVDLLFMPIGSVITCRDVIKILENW